MIISVLYEFIMLVGFLLFLPRLLYQRVRYGKYRTSFFKRFGVGFPKIARKNNGPIVWVHAVSVGECQAVASLVKELQNELVDATIVVSSITETGHEEAQKILSSAEYHVYLPFDFWGCVHYVLWRAKPDIVILTEGDFWYRFLHVAKRRGSVICLVNGKISHNSLKRLQRIGFFTKRLFSLVDCFCVQNALYKDRFRLLWVPESKIEVTGNLKCDAPLVVLSEKEKDELKDRLHISPGDFVVVIGSTHETEEELLLEELKPIFTEFPQIKVVLAPRHPERFAKVTALLQEKGIAFDRWSEEGKGSGAKVMLLDAMGILRKAYQLADMAIIGGSFTPKVGGHNILEAQSFGVPVLVGSYMYTQTTFLECSLYFDAIVQVEGDEVGKALKQLILNPARRNVLSANSLAMCKSLFGATQKTIHSIYKLAPQFFKTKGL